jgi:GDP-L-fucose synthase
VSDRAGLCQDKRLRVTGGAGFEIYTRDPVHLIAELTGFRRRIAWDASKPGRQPRRCPDVSRAKEEFGFQAKVPFEEGLPKTIEWYRRERHNQGK